MYRFALLLAIICLSCSNQAELHLEAFEVYCEMVSNDAKPVAFHYPISNDVVDQAWENYLRVAEKYDVKLFRETTFQSTMLFPADSLNGKTVIVIYQDDRLRQYQQWKEDLLASSDDPASSIALARRLGRLLGYGTQGVNRLLSKNTEYDNIQLHGVAEQVTHLYFQDVSAAVDFYSNKLGLEMVDSTLARISSDTYLRFHTYTEKHPEGQPKSTAIALLTDSLKNWYAYLGELGVAIRYELSLNENGPHDGFVATDPEGHLLEFEQFKQHPENELLMAVLPADDSREDNTDEFFGSITWTYHRDLLKMQHFYEEILGFRLVADQGWTKIYQTSPTGFIGLVDERRGMEDYAGSKAVEIEWRIRDFQRMDNYSRQFWKSFNYSDHSFTGPENYRYQLSGDHR